MPRYCGLARPTGSGRASRWKSLDAIQRVTGHTTLLPPSSVAQAAAPHGTAEGTQPPTAVVAQACASQGGSQVAPCMAACCMATERPPIPPAAIACLALYGPWVRRHGGYHSMVGAWAASAKYALHAVIQAVWEEYEWTAYCGHCHFLCHFLFRVIVHCELCGGRLRCARQLWPDVSWRIKLRCALDTTLCHRFTRPRIMPFYVARTPPSESSTWSHGSGRPGSQSASPPLEATIPVWVGDDNGWDPD